MKIADVFSSLHGISDIKKHVRSLFDNTLTDVKALRQIFPGALTGQGALAATTIADAAGATFTVTVTGAALGDAALGALTVDAQDCIVTAAVSAANTVKVRVQNESGSSKNIAVGSVNAMVIPRTTFTGGYLVSATFDPTTAETDRAGQTKSIACPGAALGDFVIPAFSLDIAGNSMTAAVSGTDVVEAWIQNGTGATNTIASGTMYMYVIPANSFSRMLPGQTTALDLTTAETDGAGETSIINVIGAALGDFVLTSMSTDNFDVMQAAYVQAAGITEVRSQNESAAAPTLASSIQRVRVIPYATPITGALDAA